MLDDKINFGPVKVVEKPNFRLHDLCILWNQAADDDLDQMMESTKRLGGIWNEPGTVWNGLLLDGRNRQIVCQNLGVPYEYREFSGTYEQAREYVIAKNLARRHLTQDQKTMFAVIMAKVDEKYGHGNGARPRDIAKVHKVSKNKVYQALTVAAAADDDGGMKDSPAIQRILAGESTITREVEAIKEEGKKRNLTGDPIKYKTEAYDDAEESYQDGAGHPVGSNLADVWRAIPEFLRIRNVAEHVRQELNKLCQHPAAGQVSVEYGRHLAGLVRELDAKMPHFVCPHCHGDRRCHSNDGEMCPLCKTRWLGRGVDDRPDCYCCQGAGYLVKEQPFPSTEWYTLQKVTT